jgi:hypothetical protein
MVTFTLNAFSKSFIPLLTNHNYSIWNCKMEILLMGANLSSIVDGTKIDPDGTNLALQIAWKNKDGQAQC